MLFCFCWVLDRINPRPAGGGGGAKRPRPFLGIAQNEKNRAAKLSESLPTSIPHILTKGKFHTYDRSAVGDVIVTSCSAILGKK